MQRNPEPVVRQVLYPNHFGHIFAVHRVMMRTKGKRHEHPHPFVISLPSRLEKDPVLRRIYADRQVFKMLVARLGRAHAQGLRNFGATGPAFIGGLGLGWVWHTRPRAKGYLYNWSDAVKRQAIALNLILIHSVLTS